MDDLAITFAPHAFDAFTAIAGGNRTGGLHGLHAQVRSQDGARHNGTVCDVSPTTLTLETAETFGSDLELVGIPFDNIQSIHIY